MDSVTRSPYPVPGALTDHRHLHEGGLYEYRAAYPAGCAGHHYRLHRFVMDVPSYQRKVLVEALTGTDAGLWFVCSVANFCQRYTRLSEPEKVLALREGSGF